MKEETKSRAQRIGTLSPTPAAWRREVRAATDELRSLPFTGAREVLGVKVPCDRGPLRGWPGVSSRLEALGARFEAVLVGPREFSREGVRFVIGAGRSAQVIAEGLGADSLWRALIAALRADARLADKLGGLQSVGFRGNRGV